MGLRCGLIGVLSRSGVAADSRARPSAAILEILGWGAIALFAAGVLAAVRPAPLTNDSYEYLSAAGNLRRGLGVSTSLIYFDSERSHRRVPAPLTTFAPAYPVLAAAASSVSGSLERGARVVSVLAYGATAALLTWALMLIGTAAYVRCALLLLFVTNATMLEFATAAVSEATYTAIATGSVALLISMEAQKISPAQAWRRAILAYSAGAVACWVRYAGYFLFAGLAVYAFLQLVFRRDRTRVVHVAAAAFSMVLVAALLARNFLTVGNWRGGNEMSVRNPAREVARTYLIGHFHLATGGHAVVFGIPEAMLLTGLLTIAALGILAVAQRGGPGSGSAGRERQATVLVAAGCAIVFYSAGMIYAGLRSVIDFGGRMFLPLMPLYLILLGALLSRLMKRWPAGSMRRHLIQAGIALLVLGCAGVNARDFRGAVIPDRSAVLATWYAKPTAQNEPLMRWFESHVPTDAPIFAADGQATGFLLHHPTIGLVSSQYSTMRWECESMKAEMRRFAARYLILYRVPPSFQGDPVEDESRFLKTAAFEQPSCGYSIAAENENIRILELGDEH